MNLNNNIRDHLKWAREHLRNEKRGRKKQSPHTRMWYLWSAIRHLQMAERGIEWMERDDG